jgi:hypothetical protein
MDILKKNDTFNINDLSERENISIIVDLRGKTYET